MSSEQEKYIFWESFLSAANRTTDLYRESKIRKNKPYIHIKTGIPGLYYSTVCNLDKSWIEICIQKEGSEKNFNSIKAFKKAIENDFGESVDWVNEEGKQRCKIMTKPVFIGREEDVKKLSEILSNRMVRFYNATNKYLPS